MDHSYMSPIVSVKINTMIIRFFRDVVLSMGRGVSIVISTSKMRNNTITVKNWNEKGIRIGDEFWKPHSNGLFVSFSVVFKLLTIFEATSRAMVSLKTSISVVINFIFFS